MAAFPRQLPFIVTTEACERFSYYGMLSILTLYLRDPLALGDTGAKEVVHLFKMAVYFLPLLGAFVADRWWGRYRTILSLASFYCLGHGLLAVLEGSRNGVYLGLALIALGAGGIKPCVSAFVGDQFRADQMHLLPKVYGLFYWSINLGAMLAFGLIPLVRDHFGFGWAFAIPGIFMGLATLVFRMGSSRYVKLPPSAASGSAEPTSTESGVSRSRILARVALVLLPVPVFWALYDQINSSWVIQGTRMTPFELVGYRVDAERIQSVSALLVLIWVPVLTFGLYPLADRLGLRPTPLRRMGVGMVVTAVSFLMCAALQRRIESGPAVSLAWQILPYTVLELGEVMVSATGLEFAYSQAPASLRSTVMSFWLLTTSLGNFLVAAITGINARYVHAGGAAEFLFYGLLMLAVSGLFAVIASRYRAANP
ncbi:MAG: POT family MFS transporter [Verrucomicrobiales bacterium]|nr:POT family MFS transporter [Verrucomicrobiales bacterium]